MVPALVGARPKRMHDCCWSTLLAWPLVAAMVGGLETSALASERIAPSAGPQVNAIGPFLLTQKLHVAGLIGQPGTVVANISSIVRRACLSWPGPAAGPASAGSRGLQWVARNGQLWAAGSGPALWLPVTPPAPAPAPPPLPLQLGSIGSNVFPDPVGEAEGWQAG